MFATHPRHTKAHTGTHSYHRLVVGRLVLEHLGVEVGDKDRVALLVLAPVVDPVDVVKHQAHKGREVAVCVDRRHRISHHRHRHQRRRHVILKRLGQHLGAKQG